MTATLILWGHALAALLFGAVALAGWRAGRARAALTVAAGLTALWALAVAGIGATAPVAHLVQAARSAAWLCAILVLARRGGGAGRSVVALAWVAGGVLATEALLDLIGTQAMPGEAAAWIIRTRASMGLLGAIGALLVLTHVAAARAATVTASAAGLMWTIDLMLALAEAVWPDAMLPLAAWRGAGLIGAALLLGIAPLDRGLGAPTLSRPLALRLVAVAGLALYATLVALAASGAAVLVGGEARATRTAIIFGATAALLAGVSTPQLRGWLRVKVAKHLFGHRYDYRVEWQRFTATLGLPGAAAEPLDTRVVRALAQLTDSPAGLLLTVESDAMVPGAAWRWSGLAAERCTDPRFAALLATGRIVALDAVRARGDDAQAVPGWLAAVAEAWAVVPLLHGDTLTGAIVLARPPVDRALDWEDFDLLRVAGRQAASYLAEDRSHAALAEARRFDEFNRRFAFLLHDIKNVASQLALVARNAERHADNPDFRADMVATLRDSAARMTALLARLGAHDAAPAEPVRAIDLAALARRLAAARRAQHPIRIEEGPADLVLARPQRLEQAIGHLLQNAIEASAADAPVTLAIVARGMRAGIEVRDRGRGMAPDFVREQLFRPFASSKPGGFGIGAFEARQLIGAMDGTLEVESREGAGSVFRILLPAAALEAAA